MTDTNRFCHIAPELILFCKEVATENNVLKIYVNADNLEIGFVHFIDDLFNNINAILKAILLDRIFDLQQIN